jgi:hypothetical protein
MRNERVREMCRLKLIVEMMKVNKLRRFTLMERMSEDRMAKTIYKREKVGERNLGRP